MERPDCPACPHLHPLPEAAQLQGIGVSTLEKLVAARKVQFTRIGGGRRIGFSDDDIAANITAGQFTPGIRPSARSRQRRAS